MKDQIIRSFNSRRPQTSNGVFSTRNLRGNIIPTHGSLTKAGKVRNQTPQIASGKQKKQSLQQRNRRNYHQMLADERFNNGRNRRGRRRRRR